MENETQTTPLIDVYAADPIKFGTSGNDAPTIGERALDFGKAAITAPLTVPVGLADTFASSLTFGLIDKGTISDAIFKNDFGVQTGVYNQWQKHEDAYRMIGDVASLFVGGAAVLNGVKSAGIGTKLTRGKSALESSVNPWMTTEGYIQASASLGSKADEVAKWRAMIQAADVTAGAKGMTNFKDTTERLAALSHARKIGMYDTAAEYIAGEIFMGLTLNKSSTFFPEGTTLSDHLLSSGAFGLGFVGISSLKTTYAAATGAKLGGEASRLARENNVGYVAAKADDARISIAGNLSILKEGENALTHGTYSQDLSNDIATQLSSTRNTIIGDFKKIGEYDNLATGKFTPTVEQTNTVLRDLEPGFVNNLAAIGETSRFVDGTFTSASKKLKMGNNESIKLIDEGLERQAKKLGKNEELTQDELIWAANAPLRRAKLLDDNLTLENPIAIIVDGRGHAIEQYAKTPIINDFGATIAKLGDELHIESKQGKLREKVLVREDLSVTRQNVEQSLLGTSMENAGYARLVSTEGGISKVKGNIELGKVDLTKLVANGQFGALDALQVVLGKSTALEQATYLQAMKAPINVQSPEKFAHWVQMQKVENLVKEWQDTQKGQKLANMHLHDFSMKYGLELTDKAGSATALAEALYAVSKTHTGRVAKTPLSELFDTPEKLAAYGAKLTDLGKKVAKAEDVIPDLAVSFNLAQYPWEQNTFTLIKDNAKRELFDDVGLAGVAKSEHLTRVQSMSDSARRVTGYEKWEESPLAFVSPINLVSTLHEKLNNELMPLLDMAKKSLLSLAGGQVSQNPIAALFSTQTFNARNIPGADELHLLWSAVKRHTKTEANAATKSLVNEINQISLPTNKADLLTVNAYLSARKTNLDLKPGFTSQGMVEINASTEAMVKRTGQKFEALSNGKLKYDVEVHKFMPDPNAIMRGEYIPLRVTEKAQSVLLQIHDQSELTRTLQNQIATSNNTTSRGKIEHFIPAIDYLSQGQKLVVDQHGRIKAYITEQSEEKALKVANEYVRSLDKLGENTLQVVGKESVEKFNQLKDEALRSGNGLLDRGKGGDYAQYFKIGDDNSQLAAIVASIHSDRLTIARDVLRTNLAPELKGARAVADGMNLRNLKNAKGEQQYDRPIDMAEQLLFGVNVEKAGSLAAKIESGTTSVLKPILDLTQDAREKLGQKFNEAFGRSTRINAKDMIAISEHLKNNLGYEPFKASEFAQATTSYKRNISVRDDLQAANSVMAYLTLLTDPLHWAMTVMTPATMGAGTIAALNRAKNETDAAFNMRSRSGLNAYYQPESGAAIPTDLSLMLATANTIRSKAFKEKIKSSRLENELYLSMNKMDDFNDSLLGAAPGSFGAKLERLGGINTGMLTRGARAAEDAQNTQIAGFVHTLLAGREVSDDLFRALTENFRNKMAGRQDFNNKPEFYKTTLGVPLGLFQNFMTHTFERIYRNVEQGNTSALKVAAAYQGALFGAQGVPGWDTFTNHMFKSWDGDKNLEQQAERAFGRDAWHAIGHGSIWSIPKLFGGNSFGLYTRGDLNIQPGGGIPQLDITQIPSIQAGKKMINSVSSFLQFAGSGGQDRAAIEALTRSMINRPLRGMMEVAQGYSTDTAGNITNDKVRDWSAGLYRVLGAKTGEELAAAELVYGEKEVEQKHRRAIGALNAKMQAYVRAGDYAALNDYTLLYLKAGGSIENVGRAFNTLLDKSNENQINAKLTKLQRNAPDAHDAFMFSQRLF